MATYNGHRNWNHWNVSLWIGNDEGLYTLAKDCIESTGNREEAAAMFLNTMKLEGKTETPDGAPYTKTTVRAALVGL